MKIYQTLISLVTAITTIQLYSSEQPLLLSKKTQKELRETLALYRGSYTLLKVLEATKGKEVKAETRAREKLENKIQSYTTQYNNDPYMIKKLKKLEHFKHDELPERLQLLINTTTPQLNNELKEIVKK